MWVGQDLAQLTTPEGQAKCIAASSYDYAAVIVSLVDKLENGIKGGECIPMNFNNGGFIFEFNPALEAEWVTPELKAKVEDQIAAFQASAGVLADWASVDYSTL